MLGLSTELANNGWRKVEIDLDETDLARLAIEVGLDDVQLTIAEAFQLLELECQHLLLVESIRRYGVAFDTPANRAELGNLSAQKDQMVMRIKQRVGAS